MDDRIYSFTYGHLVEIFEEISHFSHQYILHLVGGFPFNLRVALARLSDDALEMMSRKQLVDCKVLEFEALRRAGKIHDWDIETLTDPPRTVTFIPKDPVKFIAINFSIDNPVSTDEKTEPKT